METIIENLEVPDDIDLVEITNPVIFSQAAAEKVREIIAEETGGPQMLRVFVQGGGCSGFQYGFTLEEEVGEDDFQIETEGIMLLIDSMSMQYLHGATIDYKEDLMASQFTIDNPNATGKCGCGSSFTV